MKKSELQGVKQNLKQVPNKSSNIAKSWYDAKEMRLYIQFHNKDIYVYEKVLPSQNNDFLNASSHGSWLHQNLKEKHEYRKVL